MLNDQEFNEYQLLSNSKKLTDSQMARLSLLDDKSKLRDSVAPKKDVIKEFESRIIETPEGAPRYMMTGEEAAPIVENIPAAVSLASAFMAPGAAQLPTLAARLGPRMATALGSAGTQALATGIATLPQGVDKATENAKTVAEIDAAMSAVSPAVAKTFKFVSPLAKRFMGGLSNVVSVGKVPYNSVRQWFKSGAEIDKILAKGGAEAEAKIAKTADEMYTAVDSIDTMAQKKFTNIQRKADSYREMMGKMVGKADAKLEKLAIAETVEPEIVGKEALEMMNQKRATQELFDAYKDQIAEVNDFLVKWETGGPKTVKDLIGAKRALDTRLKDFYAKKSQGLSQGSADLVESAFSSIRGNIDEQLKGIAQKVGYKNYSDVYSRASNYYKYYDADLGSLISTKSMADKTVVDRVNALSSYIESKPGGWAGFEKTMANAPAPIKKELGEMMDLLAARRAVQAASGSQSGLPMALLRGVALSPKMAYKITRTTDRVLKTMTAEERSALSKAMTPLGLEIQK